MKYKDIFKSLGARELHGDAVSGKEIAAEKFSIQSDLESILEGFNGGIVFENGAKFKPPVKLPKCDKQGFVDLVIIYGIASDSNNIFLVNRVYKDQVGEDFYVFSESSGGDQFCVRRKSGEVYYWCHEAKTNDSSMFRVAASVAEFVAQLVPDDDVSGKSSGIISANFDF